MPMGPLELIANESELIAKFSTDSAEGVGRWLAKKVSNQ